MYDATSHTNTKSRNYIKIVQKCYSWTQSKILLEVGYIFDNWKEEKLSFMLMDLVFNLWWLKTIEQAFGEKILKKTLTIDKYRNVNKKKNWFNLEKNEKMSLSKTFDLILTYILITELWTYVTKKIILFLFYFDELQFVGNDGS